MVALFNQRKCPQTSQRCLSESTSRRTDRQGAAATWQKISQSLETVDPAIFLISDITECFARFYSNVAFGNHPISRSQQLKMQPWNNENNTPDVGGFRVPNAARSCRSRETTENGGLSRMQLQSQTPRPDHNLTPYGNRYIGGYNGHPDPQALTSTPYLSRKCFRSTATS